MGYLIRYILYLSYRLINMLIIIRVIISWIPNINTNSLVVKSLIKFTDIFLKPFRDLLEKYGLISSVDISPIIALFVIRMLYQLLTELIIF